MTSEDLIEFILSALILGIKISMPPLLSAMIVGILVSIMQASTQINEMTLSFLPKILAVLLSFFLFGHWMLHLFMEYMHALLIQISYNIK